MINWDKFGEKKKYILLIFSIILAIIIFIYVIIAYRILLKNLYVGQIEKIVEKNEDVTFAIRKVYVCSSANAIDNSLEQKMKNLNLYQYTDIALYIENFKDEKGLTNKNTIKELYIDNISINLKNSNLGTQNLAYTNLLTFGDRNQNLDFHNYERIDFNIVHNNEENESADYTRPTFYTDCSNPITLKYVNNFGTRYSIKKDEAISFDGSLLKTAGIKIEDINCSVIFKINIINNDDEYYSCWFNLKIPLNDIYDGTTIKGATASGQEYDFFMS